MKRERVAALKTKRTRSLVWPALACGVVGVVGVSRWLTNTAQAHGVRAYTREGYGGYVPAAPVTPSAPPTPDPLRTLKAAYRAGQWTEVDAQAQSLLDRQQFSANPEERQTAAEAELLAGYASAWRKNYAQAGERFLAVQRLANELPNGGARPHRLGEEPQASLEAEAGFQHAVCVGAQGDKAGAEAEYDTFLQRYPQSILVHAAVKRIARLHGGDIPARADALWKQAMQQQKAKADQERREQALCGPECLAELLRRQGKTADVHALADTMHTSADGTSLQQMADVARKNGFNPKGLALTQAGLNKQPLPLIALLRPGHYVLVDSVTPDSVTVWNPDANGTEHGGAKRYSVAEWKAAWTGVGLSVGR